MKSPLHEKQLLFRVRTKQDPDAYAALYDLYIEPVYRFVYFKLSNREEAEDVTSDIFLKTWKYLINKENKDVTSFRRLVFTVARNSIVDTYRSRARTKEFTANEEQARKELITESLADTVAVSQELESLLTVIKTLKQEYQEVLHLKHIEGYSIREIADILDKNQTNVRVILHRATKKLKSLTDYE